MADHDTLISEFCALTESEPDQVQFTISFITLNPLFDKYSQARHYLEASKWDINVRMTCIVVPQINIGSLDCPESVLRR